MNFSRIWPGSTRPNKKKLRPKSTIKSFFLATTATEAEHSANAMEDIRRQAVSMSSYGPGPSTLPLTNKPEKIKKTQVKLVTKHPGKV